MAPRVKLYSSWKTMMKIGGMDTPFSDLPEFMAIVWLCFTLFTSAYYVFVNSWTILFSSVNFTAKMEVVLLLIAGFPFVYNNFVFAVRKQELYVLTDRIDKLVESIEQEYGPTAFNGAKKISKTTMTFYSTQYSLVMLSAIGAAYYQYYVQGDKCAMPFVVYTPFDREKNFHLTQLYLLVVYTACGGGMIMGNTFVATTSAFTVTTLSKIRNQLTQMGPAMPDKTMRRIIDWHSELIYILGKINSLVGTGYVVDYLASCMHICFSGFILMKSGSETGPRIAKNTILSVACIILPAFYCANGFRIKDANEAVYGEIFKNDWLSLTPKQRKDLLMPALLVKKGLSLQFKGLVEYDVRSLFKIIKQSYSFLTVLLLMEQRMTASRQ